MSVTYSGEVPGKPIKRVRDEVKDGLAVIAFSALASTALAVALLLAVHLSD